MLEFHSIKIEDVETLSYYYNKYGNIACDNSVCATYMWREYLHSEMCIDDDVLYTRCISDGKYLYSLPIGKDTTNALKKIDELHDEEYGFYPVLPEEMGILANEFENTEIYTKQDWYDYIYLTEDLSNYSGKKYHTQKNHINKFKKTYPNWELVEFTKEMVPDIIEFEKMYIDQTEKEDKMAVEENERVIELLDNFDDFDLTGFVLKVDGEIVAFELGEIIRDTFFAHIEKANRDVLGAYSMIVNQVASELVKLGIKYINREEDVGDLGLRNSKRRYRPYMLAIKSMVFVKKD